MRGHARASGLSGLVFAALFVIALVFVHGAPGLAASDDTYANFYKNTNGSDLVTAGLYLVPFAGIAFLWFMAATRTLILGLPNKSSPLPRFLQHASGVLFVGLLFTGTALVGAVALLTEFSDNPLPSPDIARALTSAGYGTVFIFGVRAAGMFLLTTTTLARSCGLMRPWVAVISYLAGAFLLVSTTFHPVILLVFPAWVVLVSVLALVRSRSGNEVEGYRDNGAD
ncbi:MAG TPA: hypothetical protein VGJ28_15185 [Micromonosporaceae bacterium]|jgi:hypothetical protein